MAVLDALPEQSIIDGFKGTVDYYVCRGIPCARSWPRRPRLPRAPGVEAGYAAFTYAARAWTSLSPQVQDAYRTMAHGGRMSGRDLFARSYIKGLFAYPTGP